jgi:hypothetical protein
MGLVLMGSGDPSSFHCHPPDDAFSQLRTLYEKQPDRHPLDSAWSGSDANDRTGLAIQCLWSSDQPHNSNPRPANAAALLRQEDAATSAAGALDADSNGSDATAE